MLRVVQRGLKPEINGQYLHWDQLRRLSPPAGLTAEEWWLGISFARTAMKTVLPLVDSAGKPFRFAPTDGLQRALHKIDCGLGSSQELTDIQLANPDHRDRYLINSLMEEAITSSQLEGASTTRRVAKEMLLQNRPPRSNDERMIANNFRTMELLRPKAQQPLTLGFLLELHEALTRGTLDPSEVGRLRQPGETVIVQDRGTGEILHTLPGAEKLPARIDALCAFANAGDEEEAFVHPVVRAIVLHFMLAYDHPFVDGNGRTARALFYWSMLRQGYWLTESLSISRILRKTPAQYGRAFLYTETDHSDMTYFLLQQTEVIQRARLDLEVYLARKDKELREVEPLLRKGVNLNHRQRALLAHALRHSGAQYSIAPYRREHGVVYQTARQDLLDLEKAGYLRKTRIGHAFRFIASPNLERTLKRRTRKAST